MKKYASIYNTCKYFYNYTDNQIVNQTRNEQTSSLYQNNEQYTFIYVL